MHLDCLTPSARKLLKQIAPLVTKKGFTLAGGTAVALRLGHRQSVDFDFFTTRAFKPEGILRALGALGMTVAVLQEEAGTLTVSIDSVKVSFFHYPHPFREPAASLHGVRIAGLLDIASMKLIAMVQRGAKRNFVDLYFILQDIPFAKIAGNLVDRYGVDRINPVVVGKALSFYGDADLDPDPAYLGRRREWPAIKKYFTGHIRQFVLDIHQAKNDTGKS